MRALGDVAAQSRWAAFDLSQIAVLDWVHTRCLHGDRDFTSHNVLRLCLCLVPFALKL